LAARLWMGRGVGWIGVVDGGGGEGCEWGGCGKRGVWDGHNGQKKKYKRTNNGIQNIHIKLKIE
jgi:hypothetical protein